MAVKARAGVLIRLLRIAAWAPLAVIALHSIAGRFLGHEPYVDPIMHFLGGAAAAFFALQSTSIASSILGTFQPVGRDLFAFGIACAAALCWEAGEFVSDRLLHTSVQRGLANTMRDLVLGAVGGVAYIAVERWTARRDLR